MKELGAEDDAGVTKVGHIVGTPHYIAPEGVSGASSVGPASDVYAVGALAYSLVTGQHVFAGKSGAEIIGHHLHSKPQSPSEKLGRALDPFLEGLILACLSKRPEDRPADAGALLEQLEQGWKGPEWTQRDAREWWQTRAPAMLATRRAAEATGSRGPNLAVDVASRIRSSLSDISLEEEGTKTAMRPPSVKP